MFMLISAPVTNNATAHNPIKMTSAMRNVCDSAFLSALYVWTAAAITAPRAISLCTVKMPVFNGLPERLSQTPDANVSRKTIPGRMNPDRVSK